MDANDRICGAAPCADVQKVAKAVFGNGHPEQSLIVRVCGVERKLATIERLSWVTACGVGALLLRIVGAWLETLLR